MVYEFFLVTLVPNLLFNPNLGERDLKLIKIMHTNAVSTPLKFIFLFFFKNKNNSNKSSVKYT